MTNPVRALLSVAGGARRALPAPWLLRMAGTSVAAPTSAGWVTDFLNAAYYARAGGARDVDDLRAALSVLATRWQRRGRRLGARDLPAFNRAFGLDRFLRGPLGTLDRDQLMAGAARLLGDWFPGAYADRRRRAYGIAFPSEAERETFDPASRAGTAALGEPTPPLAPEREQRWSAYPPVPLRSLERTLDLMLQPERWPDAGCETGRFTPLRRGGLAGQTFEIEVVARPLPLAPVLVRGHVTATALHVRGEGGDERLLSAADRLGDAIERHGRGAPRPLPRGVTPHLLLELTAHEGHFMGRACSRLLVFEDAGGRPLLRAAGSWDPLPWHLRQAYRSVGHQAQEAFWGSGAPEASMLHQMALVA